MAAPICHTDRLLDGQSWVGVIGEQHGSTRKPLQCRTFGIWFNNAKTMAQHLVQRLASRTVPRARISSSRRAMEAHSVLATPIDEITFEDVCSFCAKQTREHVRLDYKRQISESIQIAKAVSAFANTQGGTIIWGVEDVGNRKPNPHPEGFNLGRDPRSQVITVCARQVFPPISPEVSDYIPNPRDSSKGFLVVRVPATVDIHRIDGGTGVYVRYSDKSDPQPATLETIEHLLQRKRVAVDQQAERRERAIQRLRRALTTNIGKGVKDVRRRGDVWVSAGPQLLVDPLCDMRDLRDKAQQYSVRSDYFHRPAPLDSSVTLRGVHEGVYCCDPLGEFAGLLDVYGNATLFSQFARWADPRPCPADTEILKKLLKNKNGEILCVDANKVVERILALLRAVHIMVTDAGHVGLIEARLRVEHIDDLGLVHRNLRDHLIGVCATDESIDIEVTASTIELGDPDSLLKILEVVAQKLVWAWGNTANELAPMIADRAEIAHYGLEICPNDNQSRPRHRQFCRSCRERAHQESMAVIAEQRPVQ